MSKILSDVCRASSIGFLELKPSFKAATDVTSGHEADVTLDWSNAPKPSL